MDDEAKRGLLQSIQIAQPCEQSWEEMAGDETVRFCQSCQKNVFNISQLSEDEAEKLIVEKEGKACLQLYRRADGTVITSECQPVASAATSDSASPVMGVPHTAASETSSPANFVKAAFAVRRIAAGETITEADFEIRLAERACLPIGTLLAIVGGHTARAIDVGAAITRADLTSIPGRYVHE